MVSQIAKKGLDRLIKFFAQMHKIQHSWNTNFLEYEARRQKSNLQILPNKMSLAH